MSLLSCFVAVILSQAATVAVDQNELANRINSGSAAAKVAAIQQVRQIDVARRSTTLNRALALELQRVNDYVRQRRAAVTEPHLFDTIDVGYYLAELVDLAAQSHDPVVLSPLVGALGSGNLAVRGVAKFGPQTLDLILPLFLDRQADAIRRNGAAAVLIRLLESDQLPIPDQSRVVAVIGTILHRPEEFVVINAAINVAAQTQAPELIVRLKSIASDPSTVQLIDDEPNKRGVLQDRARRALMVH